MANYDAVIKLIVEGEQALKGVQSQINELYKTIGKIEKTGILNAKASDATLLAAKQHVSELEKAAQATLRQVKQNEQRIIQQSKLNAAVDLYERRLTQATNSGAAGLKKFEGQIGQIEKAFSFFKDRKNVTAVQALATELGRMVEYSNNVNRNERARAATLSQLRDFAKQITSYEDQGLNVARARQKFDQLAVVAGSNQLNEVKKYTDAVTRQLKLLNEQAAAAKLLAAETTVLTTALGKLEEESRQLANTKLDEAAERVQRALDAQAAAAQESAAQLAKLNQRQEEFTTRTDAAAQAAARQTSEFYKQQRIAKEVAALNRTAPPAQLLLPPAAPGSPAMSGGARNLITGPVERLGGARTEDQAAMALRLAQGLTQQIHPLSQIQALYAGITEQANILSRIKALPSAEMLNATGRGIKQIEVAEDKLNGERQESIERLKMIDRLEESRSRRAQKLQARKDYDADGQGMANAGFGQQGPVVPPTGVPKAGAKKGLAGFLGKPGVPDALMGAGFPLLFGGGPGAILGGGAGGFIGGKAGGMGGMALGIVASAIGQLLDETFVQVAAISSALNQLNMDALRDSVITVNAALDYQVDQLVKAGKADEARALAAAEVTAQTGISAQQLESINGNATRLKNEFDKTLGSVQGTGALLANIFLPALTDILNLVGMVARGWNLIFGIVIDSGQGLKGWFQNLVFGEGTAQKVKEKFGGINEEQQKLSAELERTVDTLLRSAILGKQLGDIDKQRTQNVNLMGKYINIEADRREKIANAESQAAQRRSDERSKYGKLLSDQDKRNLEAVEKLTQAEKRQTVEQADRTAARERFIALNAQLVKQDTLRVDALQMQGEIEKARETATSQVLAAQIQELEQRKQIAGTLTGELSLIDAIAAKKKQSAADAFAAAQRDAALQVQIAAAELASTERAKLRGQVDELDVQKALKKYDTVVATTQENLRGAAAMQQGAASAAEIEKRLQTVATYTEQYASAAGRATNSLNEAAAAVQNQASYSQALYQAQTTLNNIQIQSLQTALSTTKDTEKRAEIIDRIKDLEIANAEITYQSTVSQIQTQVELLRIAYKQVEVRYLELQAYTAILRAQGVLKQGHLDALAAQASALRIAAGNLETAIKTGDENIRVAAAVRNAAIGAAELRAQTQGAAEAAGQYAGQMERASSASTSMRDNSFTKKVYGSTTTTSTLPTGTPIPGSKVVPFARGGIVTKPTLAIVGEAGTEYIVPQSKAAGFAANYLSGARGSSAIPSGSDDGGGAMPTINIQTGPIMQQNGQNYVSMPDMERALETLATTLLTNNRTPGGRRFQGVN